MPLMTLSPENHDVAFAEDVPVGASIWIRTAPNREPVVRKIFSADYESGSITFSFSKPDAKTQRTIRVTPSTLVKVYRKAPPKRPAVKYDLA